jgi:sodium-dependent dicarboxylate transporter 2/3/5
MKRIDWKRLISIFFGIALFAVIYLSPPWPDAITPAQKKVVLTSQGKTAMALFALTTVWWGFEVIPIGITSVAIGVIQVLFHIRNPKDAFTDFMDPAIWFIFGSLVIGMAFTRTGLTRRIAYKILASVGERTSMIYLGCFAMISLLTLMMAHTAVAATVFPIFMAVNSLYEEDARPTKFGKGLFTGMAYACGASSTVSLLGSARAPVAIGFFERMTSREVSFFDLYYYMVPLGWTIVLLLWVFMMLWNRPEKKTIPGLRNRVKTLGSKLGPMSNAELMTLIIVFSAMILMALRPFVPLLGPLDKTGIVLICTLLFFLFKVLTVRDLEEIPWNIVLMFGGAMSMGLCLWQTGTAHWLAVMCLNMFHWYQWFVYVMVIASFVLITTNFVMNVAVIAITLPVAIVIAGYLHIAPEMILFSSLATAGMPFMLLIGQAPNAIAYESKQFTAGEFFIEGALISVMLVVVLGVFVWMIWPLMGMPVFAY